MPRIARKSLETSFFHVIVQGVNKEYIFYKNKYIESYIELLNKYKDEFQVEIIAYCIMNNHAHMLIFTEKINDLSKFMHKVNAVYAQYYNEEENRVGHVFRDRYKSEAIYSENYLINCINYIHENPVKAGIAKSCEEYKYSTYRDYAHNSSVVNKKILKTILGENYHDFFIQPKVEFLFYDIDINKEQIIEMGIQRTIAKKGKNLDEILKNDEETKELIDILKTEYKITYGEIQKRLKISARKMYILRN